MNNKELGEFISAEEFNKSANTLVEKTEEIIGTGADLATTAFLGTPLYSLLRPFIEGIKDWKSRVELKQLAYFLKEFENLNQSQRSEFSLLIQSNEGDFTERLFYYITQLNDKKKASLCGKIGVAYARRKITSSSFLELIELIKSANYKDINALKTTLKISNYIQLPEETIGRKKIFMSTDFFRYEFLPHNEILKTILKNLNLIDSKLNLEPLKLPPIGYSMGDIQEALRKVAIVENFTELAFLLYEYGLKELE